MVSTLGPSAAFPCPSAQRWVLLCSGQAAQASSSRHYVFLQCSQCLSQLAPRLQRTACRSQSSQQRPSQQPHALCLGSGTQEVSEVTLGAGACRAPHLPTAGQKLAASARIRSQENPALGLCSWPRAEPRYLCHDQHTHFYLLALLGADSLPLSRGVLPSQSFIAVHTVDVCGLGFVSCFFYTSFNTNQIFLHTSQKF